MDEYMVEIEELHQNHVVLVVPTLCLLVFGRTMDEALIQARTSIAFRLREAGARPEQTIALLGNAGQRDVSASPNAA